MSPRTIVTGIWKIDYNKCKLELGQYCKVHTHPGPINTMHTCSIGAIALLLSNNNQGNYFISLVTGERIHSYVWRELPMTRDVIRTVEQIAKKEKQPLINKASLMFEWAPGQPIINNEDN